MTVNLKNRIYTSIVMIILLFLMTINNFIFCYFLIIAGIVSILEFFKIIIIIFAKNKIKKLLLNLLFTLYIFSLFSFILVMTSFLHLKILIFLILVTCVFSDIGGYVFGKIFKGPKLTKISPNKTISGSFGSLLFSVTFISVATYYLTGSFDYNILIVGFTTTIGCQVGDLFFSFLKRKSFMKDTGNFLPGHGGILDRIDGMLLGVPTGFLTLLVIY
jgi:phosphatidate cytidylyltransferase|tara:strand:- start:113 stop:763 length:651 start_codon:yes stop_codon:yes gene_type:complete